MITKEELDKLVRNEFTDEVTIKEWETTKDNLDGIYEPEYMDADRVEWVKVRGYIVTSDEDLAYFCWKCGCTLWTSQDYWDGSVQCTFWLPETEEEYQENLKEADAWWKEVMEE